MSRTVIFGPPGCGKTYRLLEILEKLIEDGVNPSEIAFVSFTNKGVDAGVSRARKMFKIDPDNTPYWRTLHSIANRESCGRAGTIIQGKHYREFGRRLGMRFSGFYNEELKAGVDDVYLFLSQLMLQNPIKAGRVISDLILKKGLNMDTFLRVQQNYDAFKKAYKLYDFTDMLLNYMNAYKILPVKYALIDEAQDLTPLQWDMVNIAFSNCEHVYIAGDDDQAIYDWCGGSVEMFLNQQAGGTTQYLTQSYRLNADVLSEASKIVSRIKVRESKLVLPLVDTKEKQVHFYTSLEDVPLDYSKSYYFLSRNNMFLNRYKTWLMRERFPFVMGDTKYPRRILSVVQKAKLKEDEEQYIKIMKQRGYTYNRDKGSFIVSTVHRVKGGEADEVVLLLDMTKAVYNNYITNRDEELRVLYVAMTRARHNLHIVMKSGPYGYDEEIST